MNTKKFFYGVLACLVLVIAACTNDSANEDTVYEFGIDKMDVDTSNRVSIDKMDVDTSNRNSIDRMDVETDGER